MIDWKKPVRFKIGEVPWEVPLDVLLLLGVITFVLCLAGAWMGYSFGSGVN
jgi:putative Mn2+ efflux pump MntP